MEKNDILEVLRTRNKGAGLAILNVLKKADSKLTRKELTKQTDELLVANQLERVFRSRHGIEKYIAKLDGAGLIDIEEFGTSHLYSLSELGDELIKYSLMRQKQAKKEKN